MPSAIIGRFRGTWNAGASAQAEAKGAVLFHFDGELISEIGVRMDLRRLLEHSELSADSAH